MNHSDDELEAMLRRALHAEADRVQPAGDGLAKIRAGISRRRSRLAWLRPSVVAAAAAAVVGVGGVSFVANQATQEPQLRGPAATGTASNGTSPSSTRTPSPTGHTTTAPPPPPVSTSGTTTAPPPVEPTVQFAAAVYRVGQTEQGPRLYREFQRLTAVNGDKVGTAVRAAVGGTPSDPDYTTPWPAGTQVLSASVDGHVATVDLSATARTAATDPVNVQQLVWTATAADTSVTSVQVRVAGADVGGAQRRAAQTDVLAPVWLLDPVDGATVGRTFTLHGDASVFEATVSWEVRQADTVVAEGFATAGTGAPGRGEWSAKVTLDPGSYVVRAFESSAQDGSAMFVDTKRITVR